MTADNSAENAASRARYREKVGYDVDLDLSLLLDLVFGFDDDAEDGEAPLTLVTPAGIIEGAAVHQAAFAQSQIDVLPPTSDLTAKYMRIQQEARVNSKKEWEEERDRDEPTARRRYVYFKEAVVTTGNYRTAIQNLKVDLAKVTAWAMGNRSYEN
jgi:hypothetical protein